MIYFIAVVLVGPVFGGDKDQKSLLQGEKTVEEGVVIPWIKSKTMPAVPAFLSVHKICPLSFHRCG